MKIDDLRTQYGGNTPAAFDYAVKQTDEYRAAKDDIGRAVAVAAAAILLRKDATDGGAAMARAEQQARAVHGAEKGLVDDEGALTWVPSGPVNHKTLNGGNDFVEFVLGKRETFRVDKSSTTINCWEAVLAGAMFGGVLRSPEQLRKIYTSQHAFTDKLVEVLVSGAGREWSPAKHLGQPVRGDIVLFSGLDHVVIATGNNTSAYTEVLNFWPAPHAKQFGPRTPTTMYHTSIEDIGVWLTLNMPSHKLAVTFGAPNWNALN